MTTLNGIARGPRKLAISLACATVLGLTATPTVAKTIHMTAPTRARLSVTKAADGTIAAEASYTSPNNRCLVAKR